MLNKTACKRCVNEQVGPGRFWAQPWGLRDAWYWYRHHEVYQCEHCTLQDTRLPPPMSCPYIAEHVVGQDG